MNEKKLPKALIALQELREEAMKKQLENTLPLVEAEIDRINPTDLPDGFESDPKLYGILKKYAYKEPPAHLEEKVMKAVFKNEYKPKTTKTTNNTNSYWNPFLVQNLRPLMYSFAGLFLIVLATIAYYQYTKPQSNSKNIISSGQMPEIKVSPSLTNTPIAIPSPKNITPDFVKSAENNKGNTTQQNKIVENNKKFLNKKRNSPQIRSEFEEIALLRTRKIDLLSIETIYVSEKINTELREELNSLLRKIDRFKLIRDSEIIFTQPDATFQFSSLDPRLIVLRKKGTNTQIWQASIDETLTAKEQASTVVLSFMENIKEAEQNTKRNVK